MLLRVLLELIMSKLLFGITFQEAVHLQYHQALLSALAKVQVLVNQ